MLVISIIIIVLVLLAALLVISDYIEKSEETFDYQQKLIDELVKENQEYRRIIEKRRKNDSDCWGR